jgi:hypothetical protein
VKKRRDILVRGPKVNDKENVKRFRLKHKIISVKNGQLYSKIQIKGAVKGFMRDFILKNRDKIKDMSITGLDVL